MDNNKNKTRKTVLVAGATGFIGSYLIERLVHDDYDVIVLKRSFDDVSRIERFGDKYKHYNSDKVDFKIIFTENKIDCVINLVTNFGRSSGSQPSDLVETNILYGLRLVEAAIAGGTDCFFNVDSALDPDVSLYAYSKRVFRDILEKYFVEKIKIMNLRLEHVYGENDDLYKFIPMAISKLKKNETLDMSLGEQQIDLIYVRDCVDAFLFLLEKADKIKQRINFFEIGTGQPVVLKDFILMIKDELKSKSIINFGAVPYRDHEQMYSKADLSTMMGWKPKYTTRETIKYLVK